jgi:hypothetical protein
MGIAQNVSLLLALIFPVIKARSLFRQAFFPCYFLLAKPEKIQ